MTHAELARSLDESTRIIGYSIIGLKIIASGYVVLIGWNIFELIKTWRNKRP